MKHKTMEIGLKKKPDSFPGERGIRKRDPSVRNMGLAVRIPGFMGARYRLTVSRRIRPFQNPSGFHAEIRLNDSRTMEFLEEWPIYGHGTRIAHTGFRSRQLLFGSAYDRFFKRSVSHGLQHGIPQFSTRGPSGPDDSSRLFSRHWSGIVASVLCPVASGHPSSPDAPVIAVTAQCDAGWPDHGHAERRDAECRPKSGGSV